MAVQTEDRFGFAYPQADFSGLGFRPINPLFIPRFQAPVVDPLERTGQIGAFNIRQYQDNLARGGLNALELLNIEFTGLQDYNRNARRLQAEGILQENDFNEGEIFDANRFNEGEVSRASAFNQRERLKQLRRAIPGAEEAINEGVARGRQMSEGRFATDAEDRAFEVASRNASADASLVRGFGDDSVFGRRASEILSAEQRLNLSRVGDERTDRFLRLGASLSFDQPIKQNPILSNPQQARTSQDVRGAPVRPASELAVGQQNAMTALSTIDPAQAIQFDIGQNQFQANLDRDADRFNSTLDFEGQKFNSSTALKVDLEKLYADVFNSQQEAGGLNLGLQQELINQQFEDQLDAGQDAATTGAIGQVIGAGVQIATGGLGGGLFGRGAGTAFTGALAAPTTIGGVEVVGSAATASGAPGFLLADGSTVAASELQGAGASGFLETLFGTGQGGGTATAGQASSLATPLAIAAAAYAGGIGIQDTIKKLQDGEITEQDLKQALGATMSGGVSATLGNAIKDISGMSTNDINNAILLSNPVTAPLALADMLFGMDLGSAFGGGKSKQQKSRDAFRDYGEEIGLLVKGDDANGLRKGSHHIQLADGSYYDIGVDGKNKLPNYAVNSVDGKTERHTYDIDWSDPRSKDSVGLLNPVALMLYGKNYQKFMGHMWNAATSNNNSLSTTKLNIQDFASAGGIDYKTGLKLLEQHRQAGNVSNQEYAAFVNGWDSLMLSRGVPQDIVI